MPESVVLMVLSGDELIPVWNKNYIHKANIEFPEQEEVLSSLQEAVSKNKLVSDKAAFALAKDNFAEFLSNNGIETPYYLFGILRAFFAEKFKFARPHIIDNSIDIEKGIDLVRRHFRGHSSVKVSEIKDYLKEKDIGVYSFIDLLNSLDGVLLIDKDTLIAVPEALLTTSVIDEIDNAIDMALGESDYSIIADLDVFARLPNAGVKWSDWLVYSVIKQNSEIFQVTTTTNFFATAIPIVIRSGVDVEFVKESIAGRVGVNIATTDESIETVFELPAQMIEHTIAEQATGSLYNEAEQRVVDIFRKEFQRGMRLQFRDINLIKHAYKDAHGEDLTLSDGEISELIKHNGFETEPNKFLHIDNLLCGTTIDEIEAFIAEQYEIGAKRIWIEPLFNHFRPKLGLAVSADLLVQIIMKAGKRKYRGCGADPCIIYSGVTLDGQKEEMYQAIAKLLEREGTHLTLDEIQVRLPAYPPFATKRGLKLASSPYIVELSDGSFAHITCVYITDGEVSTTKEIISALLSETGRTTREEVTTKLKEDLPSIFENNEAFGDDSIWKAITVRLAKIFTFNNWQIQRKGVRD